ncbi:MAG: hypothetical protein GXC75_11605 [Xanthomonadaceae bacterium]|nr:hypothetical protein [Xanthomonadaceae bacterium]
MFSGEGAVRDAPPGGRTPRYLIERDVQGAGLMTLAELKAASAMPRP